jgi:hypothetical protein
LFGLAFPVFLLATSFLIPEPYSHPFISVGLAPTKLMPFLEDRRLMGQLTILVFQRQTPNYAPITTIILVVFWFLFGTFASLVFNRLKGGSKDA